jgi:hypothetical protein
MIIVKLKMLLLNSKKNNIKMQLIKLKLKNKMIKVYYYRMNYKIAVKEMIKAEVIFLIILNK